MRQLVPVILLGLAACAPEVPNSARDQGVGFGDYESYTSEAARREALLEGRPLPNAAPTDPVISPERSAVDTVVATAPSGAGAVVVRELPADDSEVVVAALPEADAAAPPVNSADLSDEQDFEAVSARESIESDAERRARQQSEYQVVAPSAVPERPKDTGPNIVAFALETRNVLGQKLYRRSPVNAEARYERACARYTSADLAQAAFLEMGGPEKRPAGDGPRWRRLCLHLGSGPLPDRAAVIQMCACGALLLSRLRPVAVVSGCPRRGYFSPGEPWG